MIRAIAAFEIRYHLRQPLFYILASLFFILTFFAVSTDAVQIGGAVGNVNRNAPFVIMMFLLTFTVFGVLTTTAFVANAVHRDFELGTDALFFSAPIRKHQYLLGRFAGSFIVGVLIYVAVVLGIMIGSLMPWVDQDRLGPFSLAPYAFSFAFLVVPTLFLLGAMFFSVAALTRSMMATYSSVVAFFVAFFVSRAFMRDLENETVGSLLDPFGLSAFGLATRYWTVFQKNTELLPLTGLFLTNRALWIAVGLAILGLTLWRFNPSKSSRKAAKKRAKLDVAAPAMTEPRVVVRVDAEQRFGGAAAIRQYLAATRLETKSVIKSIPFVIIVLLGVFNVWGNVSALGRIFGTPVYPVSAVMVTAINGGFALFAVIIAGFYAGELVFRERTLRLNEVSDAMPLPTWAMWASKFTALMAVTTISLVVAVLTAIVLQMTKGYTNFQLDVYAKTLLLELVPMVLLLGGLAFALQIFLNNKFIGFFGLILYVVLDGALPALNLEHLLYRFGTPPPGEYSDMNGWGHFVVPRLAVFAYWTLFIVLLVAIGHLFWVRGTDFALRSRMRGARARLTKPALTAIVVAAVAFVSTGCFIFYNTNVLNEYATTEDRERLQADIEKKYKKFARVPQPRITAVKADVAIEPKRRAIDINGTYTLVNKSGRPLDVVHVMFNPDLTSVAVDLPGAKLASEDPESGYRQYKFAQPMAPGASLPMTFRTRWAASGFPNGSSNTDVVENGTFINNFMYFPHIGYLEGFELQDRNKRRKHGLGPVERARPQSDMTARMNSAISREADWIDLDTTVSTTADQIAIAPGYLQREWTANGRRHFHYKTSAPILPFWSYLSARYEVKRGEWRGLPIEIYYDADHPYNVDRMIYGVQKSLDYFTANFSAYQHKQVRILEFPRYASFAQSFPNTIPFSEAIGFIADLREEDEIDYVFYVTAHEIAHQWWAHQVIGADVQGSTMLVETLSQYSALMVMEKEYGREKMQKFLRYELDRYLRDRGGELVAEMPLVNVENQPYIHYRKGSLVMYALRDAIGEERLNSALSKFIREHAFENAPYTTAGELLAEIRAVTPPQYQNFVTDLFERIILFDNQTREASVEQRGGDWVVKLTVASTKLSADAQGEEKPVAVDDWIDIGVFSPGAKESLGKPLFVEKRRITKPVETFEIVVKEKPGRAGIDPYNKLIDRNPRDNTKTL